MQKPNKEEFVKEVTDGLMPPPAYFPLNVKMNKQGYESIDKVLAKGSHALSPEAFEVAANETAAVVLDVRHQDDFSQAHIPRSIFHDFTTDYSIYYYPYGFLFLLVMQVSIIEIM